MIRGEMGSDQQHLSPPSDQKIQKNMPIFWPKKMAFLCKRSLLLSQKLSVLKSLIS